MTDTILSSNLQWEKVVIFSDWVFQLSEWPMEHGHACLFISLKLFFKKTKNKKTTSPLEKRANLTSLCVTGVPTNIPISAFCMHWVAGQSQASGLFRGGTSEEDAKCCEAYAVQTRRLFWANKPPKMSLLNLEMVIKGAFIKPRPPDERFYSWAWTMGAWEGGRVKVKHHNFSTLRLLNATGHLLKPSLPRSSSFPEVRLTLPSDRWASTPPGSTLPPYSAEHCLIVRRKRRRLLWGKVEWGSRCQTTFSVSSFRRGDLWPCGPLCHHLVECVTASPATSNAAPPSRERHDWLWGALLVAQTAGDHMTDGLKKLSTTVGVTAVATQLREAPLLGLRSETWMSAALSPTLPTSSAFKTPFQLELCSLPRQLPTKGPAITFHVERRTIWGG